MHNIERHEMLYSGPQRAEISAEIVCYLQFFTHLQNYCVKSSARAFLGEKHAVWGCGASKNHPLCSIVWCCLCAFLIWPKGGSVDLPFGCSLLKSCTPTPTLLCSINERSHWHIAIAVVIIHSWSQDARNHTFQENCYHYLKLISSKNVN